eukprot:1161599-Pelagomonas_calceolata.AAC.8
MHKQKDESGSLLTQTWPVACTGLLGSKVHMGRRQEHVVGVTLPGPLCMRARLLQPAPQHRADVKATAALTLSKAPGLSHLMHQEHSWGTLYYTALRTQAVHELHSLLHAYASRLSAHRLLTKSYTAYRTHMLHGLAHTGCLQRATQLTACICFTAQCTQADHKPHSLAQAASTAHKLNNLESGARLHPSLAASLAECLVQRLLCLLYDGKRSTLAPQQCMTDIARHSRYNSAYMKAFRTRATTV